MKCKKRKCMLIKKKFIRSSSPQNGFPGHESENSRLLLYEKSNAVRLVARTWSGCRFCCLLAALDTVSLGRGAYNILANLFKDLE